MMKADSVIDEVHLDREAVRSMSLYNKYQNIFYDLSLELIDLRNEMNILKKHLNDYYLGRCSDDVYKNKPLNHKILKAELDVYLKADSDYIELETKTNKIELMVKLVDDYLKQISSRNYAIKNAIDYKKFQMGG